MSNWWDDDVFYKNAKSKPQSNLSPWQSFVRDVKNHDWNKSVANIGDAVGRGLKDIPGYVGDAIVEPFADAKQEVTDLGKTLTGTPSWHPPTELISDAAGRLYDKEFGPEPKPQDTADKYIHAGIEGAVSMGPFAVEAGVPALVSGAGMGVGGQAGQDLFPKSPLAPIVGSLIGGVAPGVIHGFQVNPNFKNMADITAYNESRFNPDAVSPKGAKGRMQVMDATARDPGHGIRPSDGTPADTERVGVELLGKLMDKYDQDPAKAWAAYNWGEGRVDKAVKLHGEDWLDHAPKETKDYVNKNMGMLGGAAGGEGYVHMPSEAMGPQIDLSHNPLGEGHIPTAEDRFKASPAEPELPFGDHPEDKVVSETPIETPAAPPRAEEEAPQPMAQMEGPPEEAPIVEAPEAEPMRDPMESMNSYETINEPDYEPSQEQQGLTKRLYTYLTGQESPANLSMEEMLGAARNKIGEGQPDYSNVDRTPEDVTNISDFQKPEQTLTEIQPQESINDNVLGPIPVNKPESIETPIPTPPEEMSGDLPPPATPPIGDELPPQSPPPPEGPGGGPTGPEGEGPLPKYAGSINLNRLAIDEDAKRGILSMVKPDDMEPQGFTQTIKAAQDYIDKKGFSRILKQESVALKDRDAYEHSTRVILASLETKERALAGMKGGDMSQWTPEERAVYQDTVEHLGVAYEREQANAQGAGRRLGARRITVGPTKEINDLAQNIKDGMTLEEIKAKIDSAPDKAGKIARDAIAKKALDYFRAYYYNVDLLSRPTTIEHVLGGNFMISAVRDFEHLVAAGAGLGPRAFGARDVVTMHEVVGRLVGHAVGIKKAFTRQIVIDPETLQLKQGDTPFVQAWKEHRPLDWGDRTGQSYNVLKGKMWLPGTAIARTVSAVDELSRNFSKYSEIYGAASRQAFSEGLSGKEYSARVNELTNSPTPEMLKNVGELAKQVRLQDTPSPVGKKLQEWGHSDNPTVSIPATLFFPFIRMMDAGTRLALRYTPGVSFLDRYTRSDWNSGMAGKSLALSRQAVGAGMMAMVVNQVMNGSATGLGPSDPAARKQWLVRHQEESFKVGNRWVSYSWTPFAPLISSVATATERFKEAQTSKTKGDYIKAALSSSIGFGHGLVKSGWAGALTDLFDTFEDSNSGPGKAASFGGKLAASIIVPGAAQRLDQVIDPVHRDLSANTPSKQFGNQIEGVTPGLSEKFPVQHDVYGQKLVREGGMSQWINPSTLKTIPNNDVARVMDHVGEGTVTAAPRNITMDHKQIQLTPQEHQDYQRVSGHLFVQNMRDALQDPNWSMMTKAEQKDQAKKVMAASRRSARESLFADKYGG